MTPDQAPRQSLFPDGIQPVQLYRSGSVLEADMARCRLAGWRVVVVDAGTWGDTDAAHDAFADRLSFPAYYGRNLDALQDALADVAEGRYGFPPDAGGGLIVITGFDRFSIVEPRAATALAEILVSAGVRALRFGWPLACFLQCDDPDFRVEVGGREPIGWNRQEQLRTNR